MSDEAPADPKPSSTVVPLRDGADGPEVLLVQRLKRDGTPGVWVFPGGKGEPGDGRIEGVSEREIIEVAKRTGVRETHEEAGFLLDPAKLGLIARWITPPISPRRFDTWFFATHVEADIEIQVDGSEMRDHQWVKPQAALAARNEGQLDIAPPTFVTIHWLLGHGSVGDALGALVSETVPAYEPNICRQEGGAIILYPGDAGYEVSDPSRPGARNRLHHSKNTLRYERSA